MSSKKDRVIGPLEQQGLMITPWKSFSIEFVPAWVQRNYLYYKETGTFKKPSDQRKMIFYGLLPPRTKTKKEPTPEQKLTKTLKSRERSRKHYLNVIKPRIEKMKELAEVNKKSVLAIPEEK